MVVSEIQSFSIFFLKNTPKIKTFSVGLPGYPRSLPRATENVDYNNNNNYYYYYYYYYYYLILIRYISRWLDKYVSFFILSSAFERAFWGVFLFS